MIEGPAFKKLSIFVALGILAALSLLILWPIITSIIAGLILVYIFYPVYEKILYLVKEKNTAAFIVILLTLLIIFIPLWFFLPGIIKQIFDIYLYLKSENIPEFWGTYLVFLRLFQLLISEFLLMLFSQISQAKYLLE